MAKLNREKEEEQAKIKKYQTSYMISPNNSNNIKEVQEELVESSETDALEESLANAAMTKDGERKGIKGGDCQCHIF